jgi:hypothetical protein
VPDLAKGAPSQIKIDSFDEKIGRDENMAMSGGPDQSGIIPHAQQEGRSGPSKSSDDVLNNLPFSRLA